MFMLSNTITFITTAETIFQHYKKFSFLNFRNIIVKVCKAVPFM